MEAVLIDCESFFVQLVTIIAKTQTLYLSNEDEEDDKDNKDDENGEDDEDEDESEDDEAEYKFGAPSMPTKKRKRA